MDEAKRDYIAAWIKKAENDLRNASIIMPEKDDAEKAYAQALKVKDFIVPKISK